VIEATQTERGKRVRNDRIVGEGIGKETPRDQKSLCLSERTVSQIVFFFTVCNKLYMRMAACKEDRPVARQEGRKRRKEWAQSCTHPPPPGVYLRKSFAIIKIRMAPPNPPPNRRYNIEKPMAAMIMTTTFELTSLDFHGTEFA
jgi:hypothetical protein